MKRTIYNGLLRKEHVGQKVTLAGWVSTRRNLGSLLFFDLRDSTGIVQVFTDHPDDFPVIKSEYVVKVVGTVRLKDTPNPVLPTGEVEVVLEELEVLNKAKNPPFIIADKTDALEDTRLALRYLDLRRPCMLEKLKARAKVCKIFREYFDEHDFLEIETPILNLSSPEGARDYLVPSRLRHGAFYALPQSPQLWKQLLMCAGTERYYQVARCFRDEDLRADRQPEFTQLDLEMSFLDQEEILTLMEGFLKRVFKEVAGVDIVTPLPRMKFWDAMDNYGSDKPDTRFGLLLKDISSYMEGVEFNGFEGNPYIKGIVIENEAPNFSRKALDEVNMEMRKFGLKGILSLKVEKDGLGGSFAKFLDEEHASRLIKGLSLKEGDLLLFAASSSRRHIDTALGALRLFYADKLNLIKPNTYDLLWVVDFPMFDKVDGEDRYTAEHHPFTRPKDEDLPYLDTDPEKVLAYAYDIVINGYEAGGGTLRIYDHDIQWKIFRLLGLTEEQVAEKFGWFIDAFSYGAPPHGGLAFGLERLCMILTGTDNIRDVIAFPKNLSAVDPLSHAPQGVDPAQLEDLAILVKEEEDK